MGTVQLLARQEKQRDDAGRIGTQQELQEAQATAEGWHIGKGVTRDDQRLGDRGVSVAQALLRPGPSGIVVLRPDDRGQCVREQPPGSQHPVGVTPVR
jgi:hypothetical protein